MVSECCHYDYHRPVGNSTFQTIRGFRAASNWGSTSRFPRQPTTGPMGPQKDDMPSPGLVLDRASQQVLSFRPGHSSEKNASFSVPVAGPGPSPRFPRPPSPLRKPPHGVSAARNPRALGQISAEAKLDWVEATYLPAPSSGIINPT